MPSSSPTPRYYWDACVFLASIRGEDGRVEHVKELLDQAEKGELRILTSTLSIVEVASTGSQAEPPPTEEALERIDNLWAAPSPVVMVEFYRAIAERARGLIRSAPALGLKLKPADAIHMATAVQVSADAIHTYDGPMAEWSDHLSIPIDEPTSEILQLPGI